MRKHERDSSGTEPVRNDGPDRPLLPSRLRLTAKQEAFAVAVAGGVPHWQAYIDTYATARTSRATARGNANKLAHDPKVARRIQDLRDASASHRMRPVSALVDELQETVDADPTELVRVEIDACADCWRDTDHGRDPNPDCAACHGSGIARVAYADTSRVSPAARRLVRGVEVWPDGKLKRLHLHDQTQLRIELHRLRGLHVERSVNVHLNATSPALKDMTHEQVLDMLESIRPTVDSGPSIDDVGGTVDSKRLPLTLDMQP